MNSDRNGLALAAREHLASGLPLTRMEAIVMFGVANLPDIVKEMTRQGWKFEKRLVPYAMAMARINKVGELKPPANLPIREVLFTEWRISK